MPSLGLYNTGLGESHGLLMQLPISHSCWIIVKCRLFARPMMVIFETVFSVKFTSAGGVKKEEE